jgi:GGDEF domain-containing protein
MMGDNFTPYHGNNNAYFYERFIKALVKHDSLTEWGLKKTVQRLVNKGLNSYGLNRDVFHVDADNIKLSDKYKQSLIKHETGEEILQEITMDPLDDLPF